MDLSKYRDIFGEPNEGAHSIRVFDLAVVDVVGTVAGAYLISWGFNVPFWITLVLLFGLGIALHRLFNVRTTIDIALFPNAD